MARIVKRLLTKWETLIRSLGQWQGVDPPNDPQLLSNLAANQRFPLLGTREFVRVAHEPQGNTFASLSHNKG